MYIFRLKAGSRLPLVEGYIIISMFFFLLGIRAFFSSFYDIGSNTIGVWIVFELKFYIMKFTTVGWSRILLTYFAVWDKL